MWQWIKQIPDQILARFPASKLCAKYEEFFRLVPILALMLIFLMESFVFFGVTREWKLMDMTFSLIMMPVLLYVTDFIEGKLSKDNIPKANEIIKEQVDVREYLDRVSKTVDSMKSQMGSVLDDAARKTCETLNGKHKDLIAAAIDTVNKSVNLVHCKDEEWSKLMVQLTERIVEAEKIAAKVPTLQQVVSAGRKDISSCEKKVETLSEKIISEAELSKQAIEDLKSEIQGSTKALSASTDRQIKSLAIDLRKEARTAYATVATTPYDVASLKRSLAAVELELEPLKKAASRDISTEAVGTIMGEMRDLRGNIDVITRKIDAQTMHVLDIQSQTLLARRQQALRRLCRKARRKFMFKGWKKFSVSLKTSIREENARRALGRCRIIRKKSLYRQFLIKWREQAALKTEILQNRAASVEKFIQKRAKRTLKKTFWGWQKAAKTRKNALNDIVNVLGRWPLRVALKRLRSGGTLWELQRDIVSLRAQINFLLGKVSDNTSMPTSASSNLGVLPQSGSSVTSPNIADQYFERPESNEQYSWPQKNSIQLNDFLPVKSDATPSNSIPTTQNLYRPPLLNSSSGSELKRLAPSPFNGNSNSKHSFSNIYDIFNARELLPAEMNHDAQPWSPKGRSFTEQNHQMQISQKLPPQSTKPQSLYNAKPINGRQVKNWPVIEKKREDSLGNTAALLTQHACKTLNVCYEYHVSRNCNNTMCKYEHVPVDDAQLISAYELNLTRSGMHMTDVKRQIELLYQASLVQQREQSDSRWGLTSQIQTFGKHGPI